MEREANLLRCAKLSCYAEFNRMVNAIARSSGEAGFQRLSGARLVEGTSAEYFFYTTLVSMLNHVVGPNTAGSVQCSNINSESQRVELQQVYKWFCTNKPLISAKINPKHQKPKLSLFSRPTDPLQRPQTAPASLLPLSSLESTHRRPQPGFTSGYMSRSLAISLQETEPLSTSSADWSRTVTPCHMQDRSSSTAGKPGRTLGLDLGAGSRSCSQLSQCVSVVEVPSLSHGGQQVPFNTTTLLRLAPAVAATMEWQREMRLQQAAVLNRSTPLVNTQMSVEHKDDKEERVAAITGRKKSRNTSTADHEPSPQPHNISQPQPPTPLQPYHPPTIAMITHTPSKPHSPYTHTVNRAQPPLRVVTLGPSSLPKVTSRRTVPSKLKRSGAKAASGFNCSRYHLPFHSVQAWQCRD